MKKLLAVLVLLSLASLAFAQDASVAKRDTAEFVYVDSTIPNYPMFPCDFASTTYQTWTPNATYTTAKVMPDLPTGTKRVAVIFKTSAANVPYWGTSELTGTANGIVVSTASNTPIWFAGTEAELEKLYFILTASTTAHTALVLPFNK